MSSNSDVFILSPLLVQIPLDVILHPAELAVAILHVPMIPQPADPPDVVLYFDDHDILPKKKDRWPARSAALLYEIIHGGQGLKGMVLVCSALGGE